MTSRRRKNATETAPETVAVTMEEDEEPTKETLDRPPTVSLLSKEQAVKLLNPGRRQATRTRGADAQQAKDTSLEGKFVDLADLLPLVPAKGEFDVNKIKSSLYFFS
jgi:DNA-directed RNA polymerase, mitochondrial